MMTRSGSAITLLLHPPSAHAQRRRSHKQPHSCGSFLHGDRRFHSHRHRLPTNRFLSHRFLLSAVAPLLLLILASRAQSAPAYFRSGASSSADPSIADDFRADTPFSNLVRAVPHEGARTVDPPPRVPPVRGDSAHDSPSPGGERRQNIPLASSTWWPAALTRLWLTWWGGDSCPRQQVTQATAPFKQASCRQELEELRQWHADAQAAAAGDAGDAGDAAAAAAAAAQSDVGSIEASQWQEFKQAAGSSSSSSSSRSGMGSSRVLLSSSSSASDGPSSLKGLQAKLRQQTVRMQKMKTQMEKKQRALDKLANQRAALDAEIAERDEAMLPKKDLEAAENIIKACNGRGLVLPHRVPVWKGYSCSAPDASLQRYLSYDQQQRCPDDWPNTQALIFDHRCFALPHRRCLAATTSAEERPVSFPHCLFNQVALKDKLVRWTHYPCKSFDCVSGRQQGHCLHCFDLKGEKERVKGAMVGSVTIEEVITMKLGALRLGLDISGGTGTFAAHMARYNVTVMTTAMNAESLAGGKQGLPYMETMALRGVIPLHLPHKARLPLYDNVLDLIHSSNSINLLPLLEFEELLFEWDRVLRVGGVIWLEHFSATKTEMPLYISIINLFGYKRLYWHLIPRTNDQQLSDRYLYLNCILEKPIRQDPPTIGWGWLPV